jgi:glycosyltransferase involved in cell wall biosynthesis
MKKYKSKNKKNIPSVSFIIPFFNEQNNLNATYKTLQKITKHFKIKNYELIFVNDGSTDNSNKLVNKLKKKDKKIKYLSHKFNKGLGATYKTGYSAASKKYVIGVAGDNEHPFSGLRPIFVDYYKYDLIIPYIKNKTKRTKMRNLISSIYVLFLNMLFQNNLRYYNGTTLIRKELLGKFINNINNTTMTFSSEVVIRCLMKTKNYNVVGYNLNINRNNKVSSAFKIKNILLGIFNMFKLRIKLMGSQN